MYLSDYYHIITLALLKFIYNSYYHFLIICKSIWFNNASNKAKKHIKKLLPIKEELTIDIIGNINKKTKISLAFSSLLDKWYAMFILSIYHVNIEIIPISP